MRTAEKIKYIAAGAAIGFINGFFGGGGGMLCVPFLEKFRGADTKSAHATAMLIMLPITVAGASVYLINGCLSGGGFGWERALATAGGATAGGAIGALILKKLPAAATNVIFALIAAGAGITFII